APAGEDSVSVFRELSQQGAGATTATEQLREGVGAGLPLATGLCPPDGCAPWQAWWGAAYLPLLVAAAVLAVVDLRRGARPAGEPPASRRVRTAAQFALAAAAGLELLAYVRSPAAALAPTANARYLSVLQISLPAVLWPLWRMARWLPERTGRLRVAAATATTVLAALSALMLVATADQVAQVPRVRDEERREADLAAEVRRAGVTAAYGTYWTCNRLVFNTEEGMACAVVGDDLRPGQTRYPPYDRQVSATDRPAFVFEVEEPAGDLFASYLHHRGIDATVTEVGGYRVFRPDETVRPSA
ncbi:MAG TPA: hypothetical protein VHN18_12300, partial [Micromonosporaceae bacterium]|nr:hypothetical protein [Micromonosporaceae bacterium]